MAAVLRTATRGVAVDAVRLICPLVRTNQIGMRAAIRLEPETRRRHASRTHAASPTCADFSPTAVVGKLVPECPVEVYPRG